MVMSGKFHPRGKGRVPIREENWCLVLGIVSVVLMHITNQLYMVRKKHSVYLKVGDGFLKIVQVTFAY
jgi:hypothetical protein